jgi:predicted HicB family RNase H-like nuclease
VPFAVKIDSALAARLRDLATEREMSLNDLTDELLRKALG